MSKLFYVIHQVGTYSDLYRFYSRDKAEAFLHWLWERRINKLISEGSEIDEENTFYENSFGHIQCTDEPDFTEIFTLGFPIKCPSSFSKIDWRRYIP